MMARRFSRAGPWLFVILLAWFVGGNLLRDSLKTKGLAHAKSMHKSQHRFAAKTLTSVVIRGQDDLYQNIKLVFDPSATQATINNENLQISVTGQLADNVLNIALGNLRSPQRRHYQTTELSINLPLTVKRVAFAGINRIQLSGHSPNPETELDLEILDCEPTVNIDHLTVNQLKLATTCKQPQDKEKCCHPSFSLGADVVIGKLDASMPNGKLTVSLDALPKQITLSLGDTVEVTGPSGFFRAARFNKLP